MKKVTMSLGMMMIAAALALPAFAAQQHEHSAKGHAMAQYTEPCCPGAYENGKQSPQRGQTRPDKVFVDPAQTEIPWAALRG